MNFIGIVKVCSVSLSLFVAEPSTELWAVYVAVNIYIVCHCYLNLSDAFLVIYDVCIACLEVFSNYLRLH